MSTQWDDSQRIAPAPEWRIGDVIADLYEVKWQTQGGMGVVYRVHHRDWNIDLAVKTPRSEYVADPASLRNFETEAETWVGLGLHPNVVACVYVRRLDGLPRVFAEWVDGGSLADAIGKRTLYTGSKTEVLARILDIAIQFAWGLDYAHSRGLIHQDVKPANVMLADDGSVKVTDFGLAKARAAAAEAVGGVPGGSLLAGYSGMTPAYCSPEQAQAAEESRTGIEPQPLTRATDVWSWALSVWEMFTGEPPVNRGQTAAETFAEFRADPWVDNPAIPPMPDTIAEFLARCLDPDPATRPRNMGELADELAELYEKLVGALYPRTKPEPAKLLADGLNNQALSVLDLGHAEQAEQLWQRALELDPHHRHAAYNYGLQRWRAGVITDADLLSQLEVVRVANPSADADRLLALVHLERCDTATARALLSASSPGFREDRGIVAAITAARNQVELAAPRILTSHVRELRSVAVSADGRIAVSGGEETPVRLWDIGDAACLHTLRHAAQSVAVSSDGRIAVSGGGDMSVRVWDVAGGSCLHTLTGHTDEVHSVAVSADGRIAVSGSGDKTVRVWDVDGGTCLHTLTGHTHRVWSVAVSADGRITVSGSQDNTVRIWDLVGGASLRTLTGHTDLVWSVAVSADGRTAVSGGREKALRIWDLDGGACLHTLTGHTNDVMSVAVSADGRIAVSGSDDKTVRVWDVDGGTCLRTLTGHTHRVRSVAVSADGRTAVSGSWDDTVRVWDMSTSRGRRAEWSYTRLSAAQQMLSEAAGVEAAACSAEALLRSGDGQGAAAQLRAARATPGYQRSPRLMGIWRQLTALGTRSRLQDVWLQCTLTHQTSDLGSVAVSPDGRIAVCGGGDKTVRVWDVDGRSCLHTLIGHTDKVHSVAVSADGRTAVSGSQDKTVRVWDVDAGACLHSLTGHTSGVNSVAVSADGRIAVSGSVDKTVRVWDLDAAACLHILIGHTDSVAAVALTADGRTAVSGSIDARVRVWDTDGGACLHTLMGHTWYVHCVALSTNGRIAVSGGGDKTVRVWDVDGGTCLHTLTGHTGRVWSVAVSADMASGLPGHDLNTVRVWDLRGGLHLHTLNAHTDLDLAEQVALNADATVAVTSSDGLRVWTLDWEYEFDDPNVSRIRDRFRPNRSPRR